MNTPMYGFAARDAKGGATGVHDDLYTRTLYLSQGDEEVLIIGMDLLFFHRAEIDRFKGAIAREMGLAPRQILINTSHTHLGPMVGTAWTYAPFHVPNVFYLDELERALIATSQEARETAREATVWAGATKSSLPMSRRAFDENGDLIQHMKPNPDGVVEDTLPVCLIKDENHDPIALLFSVSCHLSTASGYEISNDYPGVAIQLLNQYLGRDVTLFLQGTGGDSKASVIGQGDRWKSGTWEDVAVAGRMVADEVMGLLESGLAEVKPSLRAQQVDTHWPLQPLKSRDEYARASEDENVAEWDRMWLKTLVDWMDSGRPVPTSTPVMLHGIQIGEDLRLVGLEGEAVSELGLLMEAFYDGGITFPLGYTDGCQAYLPTSKMLDEGGYEALSCWEYGLPTPFAKGIEDVILRGLKHLKAEGVR